MQHYINLRLEPLTEFRYFFKITFPLFPCCFHVQYLYRCYCNTGSCLMKPFSETLLSSFTTFSSFLALACLLDNFYGYILTSNLLSSVFGSLFLHSSLTTLNSFHRKPRVIQILLHIVLILS